MSIRKGIARTNAYFFKKVTKEQYLLTQVEVEERTEASNSGSSTSHRADVAADMKKKQGQKNIFAAQSACRRCVCAAAGQSLPSWQALAGAGSCQLVVVGSCQSVVGLLVLHQQAFHWTMVG